jgi:hypothetical protein
MMLTLLLIAVLFLSVVLLIVGDAVMNLVRRLAHHPRQLAHHLAEHYPLPGQFWLANADNLHYLPVRSVSWAAILSSMQAH